MQYISKSESNSCSCPGDTLTFECTVARGHGTIWNGSAFSCVNSQNEIYLINSQGVITTCNNGQIVGHILGEDSEGFYTSQLNVMISSDLIGKTVQCASVNGSGEISVLENSTTTIDIISEYAVLINCTLFNIMLQHSLY